jgi:hypothetical protein
VQRELVDGAAAAIVSRAAIMDAPLIMIPTRGHTRFRQLLLGSVTTAVLHDALCPVWTNVHKQGSDPPLDGYRSIVCAVDLGPHTPHVLHAAQEFSAHLKAALHVVLRFRELIRDFIASLPPTPTVSSRKRRAKPMPALARTFR